MCFINHNWTEGVNYSVQVVYIVGIVGRINR